MTKGTCLSLALVASSLTLAGCAADIHNDKTDEAAAVEEVRLGGAALDLGVIAYGDTRTAQYRNPPRLRAYRFRAAAGDRVDVWVRSARGDAMVWVTDASRNILAQNDDADATTLDAHVTTTVTRAGEYVILFRDYRLQSQTFTVSLAGGADFFACSADRDCVVVSRGGCCSAWQRVAVNASRADAYAQANQCRPPYPPCAPPPEELTEREAARVAICNTARRQCEAVLPEEIACGGFSLNPHACPEGWTCQGPDLARDLPGRCVRGCVGPDGLVRAPGESYHDGCNQCRCGEGGVAACTRLACAQCTVNGRTYRPGETFRVACNTCTCSRTGSVACTARACACDPAREPTRRYVGDPDTCRLIRFVCATGERMFSNECGCGCEPDAS